MEKDANPEQEPRLENRYSKDDMIISRVTGLGQSDFELRQVESRLCQLSSFYGSIEILNVYERRKSLIL